MHDTRPPSVSPLSRLATSPARAGESHMGCSDFLEDLGVLPGEKEWILKESPDSQGDVDGSIPRTLWACSRSAGGERQARSGGDSLYRVFGSSVRGDELLGDGGVWFGEGSAASPDRDLEAWDTEPRDVHR